jgi:hypothetical protein
MKPAYAWVAVLALVAALPASAQPPAAGPIQIVSALYGWRDDTRPVDFTARLQSLCGGAADHCETFCSPAFIGERPRARFVHPDGRPVCRVMYRCGETATLSSETERDDTILLSCLRGH